MSLIKNLARAIPVLAERTTLSVSLQGWPAAAAVFAVGATAVALAALLRKDSEAV